MNNKRNYSAAAVKHAFWFMEFRKVINLRGAGNSWDEIKKMSEGLLSYIGFGREGIQQLKYLAGFDEHFLYMINLSKDENKNDNDAMKTIGNHYDINKITNIEVVQDDNFANKILINILFVLDNDVNNYISKIKKLYFEKPNALKFLNLLKAYLI